jgi:branched-chain amino acid transport system substrate-binding protein
MRVRVAGALVVLVVAALLVTACGDDGNAGGGGSDSFSGMTIGQIAPLTGALDAFGPAGVKGGELAVEQLNAALKKTGSDAEIHLETADDQTTPEGGVSAARKLISSDKASCVSGPWLSAGVIAVSKTVTVPQSVALVSPASGASEVSELDDKDLVYRITPNDNLQGAALFDVVSKDLGGTDGRVALGGLNDTANEGVLNIFADLWKAKGGSITGPVLYDVEETALDSVARSLTADAPDAFFFSPSPDTWPNLGAALLRTDTFDAKKAYFSNAMALIPEIPADIPPASMIGAKGVNTAVDEDSDAFSTFVDLYTKSPKKPSDLTSFGPHGFDAAMLCGLAAVAAGSDDPEAIGKQLRPVSSPPGKQFTWQQLPEAIKALEKGEDIDYVGATGPIDWDVHGDPGRVFLDVYTYDGQGKYKVIDQVEVESEATR